MNILTEQIEVETLAYVAKFDILVIIILQIYFKLLQFICVDLTIAVTIEHGEDLHD